MSEDSTKHSSLNRLEIEESVHNLMLRYFNSEDSSNISLRMFATSVTGHVLALSDPFSKVEVGNRAKLYVPEHAEDYPRFFVRGCLRQENLDILMTEFVAWWRKNDRPLLRNLVLQKDNDFSGPNEDRYVLIARPGNAPGRG